MQQQEFDLYLQRARKFQERLSRHLFFETIPLTAEVRHSVEPIPFAERLNGEFRPIREGEKWGDSWDSGWFRLTAELPQEWAGRPLALRIGLGGEAMLFDEAGVPKFGFSAGSVFGPHYRKELYQLPENRAGKTVEFWVEAAANALFGVAMNADPELDEPHPYGKCDATAEVMRIGWFNRELWLLTLDLEVLLDLLNVLPPRCRRADLIVSAVSRAADAFAESPANAAKARAELVPVLEKRASASAMTAVGLGHAHIDTGWMWPVRETVRKCARTFASQIDLIEKYPGYVFGASSPQHYLYVKEHYPALYEKVKAAVKSGRWELLGGMWVEADCNMPGGESLVRQFLHGKNFFRDEFGVEVDNLWIPDVFGYPASLPQIAKLAGCPNFLTQKMSWSWSNRFPYHAFFWRGLDGSELLAHFPPENTYNAVVTPSELVPAENRFNENTVTDEFVSLFGIGDGGGGPKEEYLERAARLADLEGAPKFKFDRADRFFRRLAEHSAELPRWEGELYLEYHRGTMTVQARTKKNNRKLEELLAAAEALWCALPLPEYPAAEFDRIWKVLLLNQFHDIIPGSSIRKVYEVTEREHAEALAATRKLLDEAASRLLERDGEAVTFFNSLNIDYTGPVELPENWAEAAVVAGTGPVPVQADGSRVTAEVKVPASGFLTLRRNGTARNAVAAGSGELLLENGLIRYRFDADGRLISAFDKQLGREFIPAGTPANLFSLYVDRSNAHEAWDIEEFYINNKCGEARSTEPARAFSGAVQDGLEFVLRIGSSTIRQRVTLGKHSRRLDFETAVHWDEARKMLRVAFPLTVRTPESTSDIQFGFVRRPTHTNTSWDTARFEVPIHKYADLSEYEYGAALLNDCKYGCRLLGNVIDLALLRAPKYPDWDADRGDHTFTYSFLPHANGAVDSEVRAEALRLNRPPQRFDGLAGSAELPVRVEAEQVELATLKKAEKEDCAVVRLVERGGRHSSAVLHTACRLVETGLTEWEDGAELTPVDGRIVVTFRPFEIKTFKLKK